MSKAFLQLKNYIEIQHIEYENKCHKYIKVFDSISIFFFEESDSFYFGNNSDKVLKTVQSMILKYIFQNI